MKRPQSDSGESGRPQVVARPLKDWVVPWVEKWCPLEEVLSIVCSGTILGPRGQGCEEGTGLPSPPAGTVGGDGPARCPLLAQKRAPWLGRSPWGVGGGW